MNIELSELLGKNYYSYVAEERAKYQKAARKSKSQVASDKDDFIMLPVVDFVFKRLFGDYKRTERLKSLLSSILEIPVEDLENLIITNPELPKDFSDDKYGRLDIKIILKDGKQVNIEMQVLPFPMMVERSLYYWSKMFSQQIKEGEHFGELKKCIAINILDYDFPLEKNVHSVYHISEDKTKNYLTEALEVHFIDLDKLRKGMGMEGLDQSLLKWLRFLAAKRKEEFEVMAKNDSELQNAYKYLQEMSADEKERMVYEAREAWLLDKRTIEFFARKEGIEKGIEQGIERGRADNQRETALKALKVGLPIDTIIEITGLSEEEIKKIVDKLNE